jgi:nitrate/TMAO reductase-like tetraheme cytochrome c subunit
MLPFALPSLVLVVKTLGVILGVLGILLCVRVLLARPADLLAGARPIRLGITTLPRAPYLKLVAFAALILVPAGAVAIANYHVFEGVEEVSGCAGCHTMWPMVNDMQDPKSGTLAARHFRGRWIADRQCYHCHSDYGLSGTVNAKLEGYRHLARYVTRTYPEPIRLRGQYLNGNCLNCHAGMATFERVPSHHTVEDRLASNRMTCLNCHGLAHPSPAARTPGSREYGPLMARPPLEASR